MKYLEEGKQHTPHSVCITVVSCYSTVHYSLHDINITTQRIIFRNCRNTNPVTPLQQPAVCFARISFCINPPLSSSPPPPFQG